LRTPIPLSVVGGLLLTLAFVWLHLPVLLAVPLGYLTAVLLGYGTLRLAGDQGMAMGAQAVSYREGRWQNAEEAARALAPYLYHGWTHLAGRRGLVRLHNSLAVATAYVRAREQGDVYHVSHFPALQKTVEAGYQVSDWRDLERAVNAETRGPLGWLREWTKYQYLGHSRNAYVLGGLLAGRAVRLAKETGADPWSYLRAVAGGQGMAAAEQQMRNTV
ncbi:MAG: hypothetical protein ACR2PL_25375, partial [Dehalococcoidia bacterium]